MTSVNTHFRRFGNKLLLSGKFFLLSLLVLALLSACGGGQAAKSEGTVTQNQPLTLQSNNGLSKAQPAAQTQPVAGSSGINGLAAQAQAVQQNALAAPLQAVPGAEQVTAPQAAPPPVQSVTVDTSIPEGPQVGSRAPNFTMQTLDGRSVTLSDLVGRPVVINYWTTWCIPCQNELPLLEQLHKEYQSSGLVIITVNALNQDAVDKIQAMVAEKGLTFPVLLDENGAWANTYQAVFFPTTFFVDPSGVIRHITLGDSTAEDLRAKIQQLLAGSL